MKNILTEEERQKAVDIIHSLDKCWLNRSGGQPHTPRVPFWTLGAVTYLDGTENIGMYHRHRKAINPILKKKFTWLYDILCRRFEEELGDPCVIDDKLGHPGFHVFGQKRGISMTDKECFWLSQPLASIHTDIQYKEHNYYWKTFKEYDLENTLNFTLALEMPKYGGGLYIWDWVDMDQDFIDNFNFQHNDDKNSQLKNKYLYDNGSYKYSKSGLKGEICFNSGTAEIKAMDHEPLFEEYIEKNLVYFTGHIVHQIAPARYKCMPDDNRITLQGHAIKCDGVWRMYF